MSPRQGESAWVFDALACDGSSQGRRLLVLGKRPKPVRTMTEAEIDQWAGAIAEAMRQGRAARAARAGDSWRPGDSGA